MIAGARMRRYFVRHDGEVFLKAKILTLLPHYLPGYKYGGPVRTVASIVDQLGDELEFSIITSDRDLGDREPFPDIAASAWSSVGKARVYYASPDRLSLRGLAELIRRTPHDVLYLNTYFEPVFTLRPLLARKLGLLTGKPVIVSPQGVFSPGALALKALKKSVFLEVARIANLNRGVIWQASSELEADDIRAAIGSRARIVVSPDFSSGTAQTPAHRPRRTGEPLRVVFVSRITPKKNLDYALRVLARVRAPVILDIYGPVEDEAYWAECQKLMAALGSHVTARYHGSVAHAEVLDIFAGADLFLFPTRGENFGHVVIEAMLAGTPVLTSDATPWQNLESLGLGWDLPLSSPERFVAAVEHLAALDAASAVAWRARIQGYARRRTSDPAVIDAKRQLFTAAAAHG